MATSVSSNVLAPGMLAGLHVVVTGSSGGIGRAITTRLLALEGAVHGLDLAVPTVEHPRFTPVPIDLLDGDRVTAAAHGLVQADALVHAAGVLRVGRLGTLDHAASDAMWRIHVDAAMRLADVLVPRMAKRSHGRVVFLGSRVGHGMPGRSQYAAVKAALVALARSWAREVVADGVTVNVVAPAATATPMLDDPARAASAPRVPPLGRLIDAREIAEVVCFLLSPAAAAITGQEIAVCGGASLPS